MPVARAMHTMGKQLKIQCDNLIIDGKFNSLHITKVMILGAKPVRKITDSQSSLPELDQNTSQLGRHGQKKREGKLMHRCLHLAVCSWLNTLARALRARREPRQRPHQKGAKIGVTAQCTHLLSSQSPEVRDATVADNNPVAREKSCSKRTKL